MTVDAGQGWGDAQIVVHSLETGERKVLVERGRDAQYIASGHLVYVLGGTLFAIPFDLDRLETRGGAVPIVEDFVAAIGGSGAGHFGVSDTGSLVYVSGSLDPIVARSLVWVDRSGNEEMLNAEPRVYIYPRISPDGSQLALDVRDRENDIWIWHFAQETLKRFTFYPGSEVYPAWTPDGRKIAFSSQHDGPSNVYWKSADGSGTVERLTEIENEPVPYGFSANGDRLLIREFVPETGSDLRIFSLDGSSESILSSESTEANAAISPDGAFIAYDSDESGRPEVYVRPFPNVTDGQWQISADGGTRPLWAPDGRELFYLALSGELMAARLERIPTSRMATQRCSWVDASTRDTTAPPGGLTISPLMANVF